MADREDTDSKPQKGRTDPGLGPGSGSGKAAAPANGAPANGDGAPVDFDALHAALGANASSSGRAKAVSAAPAIEVEVETPEAPRVAESQGRSSASYAATHVVPTSAAPTTSDPSVPAVIVEADTNPGGQSTVPMGAPSSGPHLAAPPATSSGPYAAASPSPSYPGTPPGAFPVQRAPRQTVAMPHRPRRPKSATVVVRPRGPSTLQKAAAFIGMLLLVMACGVAVIVWRRPKLLGFEQVPTTPAPTQIRVVPPATATATATASAAVAPPDTASAAPSASAAPVIKKKKP